MLQREFCCLLKIYQIPSHQVKSPFVFRQVLSSAPRIKNLSHLLRTYRVRNSETYSRAALFNALYAIQRRAIVIPQVVQIISNHNFMNSTDFAKLRRNSDCPSENGRMQVGYSSWNMILHTMIVYPVAAVWHQYPFTAVPMMRDVCTVKSQWGLPWHSMTGRRRVVWTATSHFSLTLIWKAKPFCLVLLSKNWIYNWYI